MSKVCSFCGNTNFKAKKVQYIYPLYLDIALDAEIVYDDTNFLENLMEEALLEK